MSVDYPSELVCPISQDLMNDPVKVSHDGVEYSFDRVCVDTWKKTPGGNKNPLTMVSGFREAEVHPDVAIKSKINDYRKKHNIVDVYSGEIKLEPFSDYQQIQDDEAEARKLDIEMNGPLPLPDSTPPRLSISWMGSDGSLTEIIVDISPELRHILYGSNISSTIRQNIMNRLVNDIINETYSS